jgi:Zn-dependent peptidase ImmA (M78 family)
VSAVIVANAGEKPTIYVSSNDHLNRQRFSCSHEIGHYIRRIAAGATEFGFVDRRDDLSSKGTHPEERWANQFAAALLMPADVLRTITFRQAGELARLFGVSEAAMKYRLSNLGLSA